MKKVLIIDTSLLCVWLNVSGMETCGKDTDEWNFEKVDQLIQKEISSSTTLVLPLATIIETGNHIAQAKAKQRETAKAFAKILIKVANETTPWAAFTKQSVLWNAEGLEKLASEWINLAVQKISIGDATIKMVAEHYAKAGCRVEILTADKGLKAYEPIKPVPTPRRKKG